MNTWGFHHLELLSQAVDPGILCLNHTLDRVYAKVEICIGWMLKIGIDQNADLLA
jgi:hypothetical protein